MRTSKENMFSEVLKKYEKKVSEVRQRAILERERRLEDIKRIMPPRKEWNRLTQQFERFEEEIKCLEREVRNQQTKRGIEARKNVHASRTRACRGV